MDKKCLVSVIVLTYRNFDNIDKNIASILEQSYKNIQIIIHDDGSENFNEKYLNSLLNKSGREYIITTNATNMGTVKNYNNAIKVARGSIIIPLSQDDIFYDKKTVQKIVDFFELYNCDICQGKRIGRVSNTIMPNKYDANFFERPNKECWIRLIHSNYISGSSLYFKKDFIVKMGLFDENYFLLEDRPFVTKVIGEGYKIFLMNEITIEYGEGGVSSKKPSRKILDDYIVLYSSLIKQIENENLPYSILLFAKKRLHYYYDMIDSNPLSVKKIIDSLSKLSIYLTAWIKGKNKKEYEIEILIDSYNKEKKK